MRKIIPLLFILSSVAHGAEFSVVVDTWSSHSQGEWKEHNQALGIEYVVEQEGWHTVLTAVSYTDSMSRDSRYAGAGLMYPFWASNGFEVTAGAFLLYFDHEKSRGPLRFQIVHDDELFDEPIVQNVYHENPKSNYFAPIPGVSFSYKNVGANLAIIPPINSYDPWTAALQFKLTL